MILPADFAGDTRKFCNARLFIWMSFVSVLMDSKDTICYVATCWLQPCQAVCERICKDFWCSTNNLSFSRRLLLLLLLLWLMCFHSFESIVWTSKNPTPNKCFSGGIFALKTCKAWRCWQQFTPQACPGFSLAFVSSRGILAGKMTGKDML